MPENETIRILPAAGVTLALSESYTAGEKDYTALVSKMKDAALKLFTSVATILKWASLPARWRNRA